MFFTPSQRITNATSSEIHRCLFEFLQYDYGSAIFVTDNSWEFEVDRSLFRFCISRNEGGAINIQAKSFLMIGSCFDTCYIGRAVNELFGNAIYASKASSVTEACLNTTVFLDCGPNISISADSTVAFVRWPLAANTCNFSNCHSYEGASSITLYSTSGKASYIDLYGGIAATFTCTFVSGLFSIFSSNFIDWKQMSINQLFFSGGGQTTIESCCIFIPKSDFHLGVAITVNNCIGNVGFGIPSCPTSTIPLPLISADNYCNPNGETEYSPHNTPLKITHISISLCLVAM